MSDKNIRIETNSIYEPFKGHLNIEHNNRILFSAPFGSGKTTFLDEFFTTNESEYTVVKLYPINYSVSQNEDVFELIKFDLLFELITKHKLSDEINNYSFLLMIQMFLLNNNIDFKSLLPVVIKQFGRIGKGSVEVYEEFKNQFEKYKEEIQDNDEKKIIDFINKIENKTGTPYELDPISSIIQNHLEEMSFDTKKKSVLIIDDLDRLDPEHIFRLFNVFSVHFNQYYDTNKFGFDKIIFVCDIDNIKNIYHHKYGKNVDFTGYIDKFYSLSPFEFDTNQFIKDSIKELIYNNLDFNLLGSYSKAYLFKDYNYNRFLILFRGVIYSLLDSRKLNLRMLIHPKKIQSNLNEKYFNFNNAEFSPIAQFEIIVLFYMLKSIYGSFNLVEDILFDLSKNYSVNNFTDEANAYYQNKNDFRAYKQTISFCLPFFLDYNGKINHYEDNVVYLKLESNKYLSEIKELNTFAVFGKFTNNNYNKYRYDFERFVGSDNFEAEEDYINPYIILYKTFKICRERGAF